VDKIFKAMTDKNRRKIITLLKEKELSVNELLKNFDIRQATLSNHLAILKKANLVSCKVLGKQRIYSLNNEIFLSFVAELNRFGGRSGIETEQELKIRGK
jgi:DNA-binding transcriptional ArsR family regulator